jgi:hypothetical protein
MAQNEYVDEFRTRLRGKRSLWKALGLCALAGGLYGATVGAAIGAVPGAAVIVEIAAGVLAVLCGVPGARIGVLLGMLVRNRFGKLFLGLFAAVGGAIVGGFLAMVLLLALGAIVGAVVGWIVARGIIALRHDILRRFVVGIAGAALGTFIGAISWAVNLNEQAALGGAAWGGGIGIVVGPLLLLAIIRTMNALAESHIQRRRTYIDATFHSEEQIRED